jgi:heme exporter protein B
MTPPGWIRQTGAVLRKDLLIGWRSKARLLALALFALTMLLLFSFAIGPNTASLRAHAGGYLWMGVLVSSTLLLAQNFQIETEGGALEGLLLLPVDPRALFYGKALANLVLLVVLTLITLPLLLVLYDIGLDRGDWLLAVVIVLGCAGVSAPGTLYSALTSRAGAQQLMLPVLLFPLVIPCMLAAVKATGLLLTGDPMEQAPSWTVLLVCFDLIYWSLGGLLFARVIEE